MKKSLKLFFLLMFKINGFGAEKPKLLSAQAQSFVRPVVSTSSQISVGPQEPIVFFRLQNPNERDKVLEIRKSITKNVTPLFTADEDITSKLTEIFTDKVVEALQSIFGEAIVSSNTYCKRIENVRSNPNNAEYWRELARSMDDLGRHNDFIGTMYISQREAYRLAIELDPNVEFYLPVNSSNIGELFNHETYSKAFNLIPVPKVKFIDGNIPSPDLSQDKKDFTVTASQVQPLTITSEECINLLSMDNTNAQAWYTLGLFIQPLNLWKPYVGPAKIYIGNEPYTQHRCFTYAFLLSGNLSYLYLSYKILKNKYTRGGYIKDSKFYFCNFLVNPISFDNRLEEVLNENGINTEQWISDIFTFQKQGFITEYTKTPVLNTSLDPQQTCSTSFLSATETADQSSNLSAVAVVDERSKILTTLKILETSSHQEDSNEDSSSANKSYKSCFAQGIESVFKSEKECLGCLSDFWE